MMIRTRVFPVLYHGFQFFRTLNAVGPLATPDIVGINATVIATIHGIGGNNGTLIDEIGKYYDLAVNGFDKLMSLHCTSYGQYSNQTDCRTYFTNGTLTSVNRYSLREWSHNNIDKANFHNDSKTFEMFVDDVNIQEKYNKVNGPILVVPIVAYHSIDTAFGATGNVTDSS
jgi:hypothetical protein